jgi:hypothetical protein
VLLASVDRNALLTISLKRQQVLISLSSKSKLLVYVSSSNSNLTSSLALYTLLIFLSDFLGLTDGLGNFRGDRFFFLRCFLVLYSPRSFQAFTSVK